MREKDWMLQSFIAEVVTWPVGATLILSYPFIPLLVFSTIIHDDAISNTFPIFCSGWNWFPGYLLYLEIVSFFFPPSLPHPGLKPLSLPLHTVPKTLATPQIFLFLVERKPASSLWPSVMKAHPMMSILSGDNVSECSWDCPRRIHTGRLQKGRQIPGAPQKPPIQNL